MKWQQKYNKTNSPNSFWINLITGIPTQIYALDSSAAAILKHLSIQDSLNSKTEGEAHNGTTYSNVLADNLHHLLLMGIQHQMVFAEYKK